MELVLPKELQLNDSHVLSKRKKYFNTQLVKNLEVLSFILVIISYLNTLSLLDFVVRLSQQLVITRPFPKSTMDMRALSGNVKRMISKSIFQMLIVVNLVILCFHLVFTVNISGKNGGLDFSHGGWTLQIIGESKFNNWFFYKLFIFINDILIFISHMALYFITCLKNEELVPEEPVLVEESLQQQHSQQQDDCYDGYSGNTTVIELNPLILIKHIKEFRRELDQDAGGSSTSREEASVGMPGGFQAFTNFSMDSFV